MNQTAIDLNNKGVELLELGQYNDAHVMFLGSMQLILRNDVQGGFHSNEIDEEQHCHIKDAIAKRNSLLQQQEKEGKHQLCTRTRTTTTTITTEDKIPIDQNDMYRKAMPLSPLTSWMCCTCISNNNTTQQDEDKDEKINVECTLRSAIVLYNTALTHHILSLINTENADDARPSCAAVSMDKAVRLYEMACDVIGTIPECTMNNSMYACLLAMATVTNMVHLYNQRGKTDLAANYTRHLSYLVGMSECHYKYNHEEDTTIIRKDMKELSLSAVSTLLQLHYGAAAGAA